MFLQRVQPIFNGVKSEISCQRVKRSRGSSARSAVKGESHSETGKLKKSRDFFNFFVTLCNKSYLHPSYS